MSDLNCSRDYWEEIGAIADSVKEEVIEYGGDIYDKVWEICDGHEWVIYCGYNIDVLKYSDNAESGIDDGIVDAEDAIKQGGLSTLHAQLACSAMIADVTQKIGDWEPETCSECGTVFDPDEHDVCPKCDKDG